MKKISLSLSFLIFSIWSFSQYPNGIQTIGTDSNLVKARGGFQARLIPYVYFDTAAANLERISQYPGSEIYTASDQKKWYRNQSIDTWIQYASGSNLVANGITLSGDTIILGDSLNRFTYIQVLSHQTNGTRFNHLRFGNLPESQSIGGTVPVYPYTATYNPSTLSIDRLYSEANNDTAYLQYGGGFSGVTRFNFDSVGIYGATLPRPKEISMPSQGVEYLYQINLPRDSVRFAVARDGQQASVFVAQHDWGQTWGYNTNVYSTSNIPDMPISTYKANLDFQRNIDNTRRYKMTGNGVAQYLSAYKTYQSTINGSTYEAGDYVSQVTGFMAYGPMYPFLSTDTKAKTSRVSTVDSSFGFRAKPQYRYTNDINNGYGLYMEGDSDYNHINGWLTVGGSLPTRANGGQLFRYKLNVTGKGHFTDSLISDGNISGFITKGQALWVALDPGLGSQPSLEFYRTDSLSRQQAVILAETGSTPSTRYLALRIGGNYTNAQNSTESAGQRIQFETGPSQVNLSSVWRNGNWTLGNSVTSNAFRLYKKLTVNGSTQLRDTLTLENAPLQAIDTSGFKLLVKRTSNGDVLTMPWAFASSGGTVTNVVNGYGLSGGPITTTGTLLFDSATVFPQIRTSIFSNIANNRIAYSSSGALTGSSQFTFTGQALQLASTNTTQTTTSSAFVQTYNNLTAGTGEYIASSSLTSGNLSSIVSTSTALAANNEALNVDMSGANGTNAITATGIRASVTNTNATSGTNVAGDFSATGATTDNIGLNVSGGRLQVRSNITGLQPSLSVFTAVLGASNADTRTAIVSNNAAGNTLFLSNSSNLSTGFYLGSLSNDLVMNNTGATQRVRVTSAGAVIIGTSTTALAWLSVPAGTTAANTAPVKLATGTSMTTAEAGALEYTTPQLFFTNGGAIRQELFQGQQSRVSTQFDKTDATLANITGLTANVAAGKTYRFEAILYIDANLTGGSKYAIAGTSTATNIIYQVVMIDNTTNANTITSRQTALAGSVGQAGTTTGFVKINGTITINAAGTLTCQFAQNSANGTSSVLVGSTFVVTEIL